MLPYVGDSFFPDEICYLNSGGSLLVHFPVYMRGAHYSSSDKPKDLDVLPVKRGALYTGEDTLKSFKEMPYALERGQMNFDAEKSKQSVNRDELKSNKNIGN